MLKKEVFTSADGFDYSKITENGGVITYENYFEGKAEGSRISGRLIESADGQPLRVEIVDLNDNGVFRFKVGDFIDYSEFMFEVYKVHDAFVRYISWLDGT